MDPTEFVSRMPRSELHVHVEGTLERDLLVRPAAKYGVEVPLPRSGFTDLTGFIAQ